METLLVETVRMLRRLDDEQVGEVLRNESKRLEITKSLLNLLFNICLTRAIPLSQRLKIKFRQYDKLALELLSGANRRSNQTRDLRGKRRLLLSNLSFVRLLAEACPSRPPDTNYVQPHNPWVLEAPALEGEGEAAGAEAGGSRVAR